MISQEVFPILYQTQNIKYWQLELIKDFFEMRKCDDDQEPTTEKSYTDWTTTQTEWHTSATHDHTTNPNPTSTLEPHEPDYVGFEMASMVNSSYTFEYSMSEINYDYY